MNKIISIRKWVADFAIEQKQHYNFAFQFVMFRKIFELNE